MKLRVIDKDAYATKTTIQAKKKPIMEELNRLKQTYAEY